MAGIVLITTLTALCVALIAYAAYRTDNHEREEDE